MPERESLVRGPSDVRRIWFMGSLLEIVAAAGDTGGAYSLVLQTIPPGLNPAPPHRHADKDEGFYILDGALTVRVGERTVDATTGSFLSIPQGVVHGIWNNGAVPAKLLALFHPGGFEQFFLELGEPATGSALPPRPAGPPDLERLIRVAQKYQTELVIPGKGG